MAGVNQVIMLSLSMVVIAGMVGAGGLGGEIVRAIGRINVGLGFEAGLSVVMIAMILDRLTSALGRPRAPRRAARRTRNGGSTARPSRGESAADTDRSADSTRMERTSA
jgi:ABC-type proline/glycine betaine transport system permease subunit